MRKIVHLCKNCGSELSRAQRYMKSCIHCGYKSEGEVIETTEKNTRYVVTFKPKWWQVLIGIQEKGRWEYED